MLKFFIETTTEEQLLELIEHDSNESNLESFIEALFAIVVDVPVQDTTYGIHLEAITCLLILLSVQFHSGQRSDNSIVYHTIMNGRHVISSPLFVKCLMINFINQKALPAGYGAGHGHSLVIGM